MSIKTFEKINDIINCKIKNKLGIEFTIPLREDGFIHATAVCKINNKKVNGWLRLKETKLLVIELEKKLNNLHKKAETQMSVTQNKSEMLKSVTQLIEIYRGNSSKYS
jgi:hypothetical protein